MKLILYYIVIYIFIATSRSSIYPNLKSNFLSLINNIGEKLKKPRPGNLQPVQLHPVNSHPVKSYPVHSLPVQSHPVNRRPEKRLRAYHDLKGNKKDDSFFRLDPVLNYIRRNARRRGSKSSSSSSSSSSLEMKNWKDQWRERWIQKKFEAINTSSYLPGDAVNMVGARPWGVPCGDPNQHDMPWGTCMLPMECEAEYRIYRGDLNCGRTQFVCCSLQLTAYDMYQGFSISFEDSGLVTDTQEKKNFAKASKEDKKKHKTRDKRKRQRARRRRKRQIKRKIRKINREIKKIINKQDRNASKARKRKTKQLKKFIDMLKEQYKKDRRAVQDIHEHEMIQIDEALKLKLTQINDMNQNFAKNETFRDIIVNGTLNRHAARMLVEAYPELNSYINVNVRRSGTPIKKPKKDYLDYDVEYGMLYY